MTITAQGSLVKLTYGGLSTIRKNAPHRRGKVSKFSQASRKRLLDLMARLDVKNTLKARPAIFITLTYGQNFPSPTVTKAHLEAFKKRLLRFAPNCSALWRMEFQTRGAPHYHLLVFNLPYLPKDELARWWHEIVGDEFSDWSKGYSKPPFTKVEAILSPKRAFSYVSKYIAKYSQLCENSQSEDEEESLPSEDELAFDSGFNNQSYLDESPKEQDFVGRFWGVINRDALPFAELFIQVLPMTQAVQSAYFDFRRLMAKKWGRANKMGHYVGATIYVWDASGRWWDVFYQLLGEAIGFAF